MARSQGYLRLATTATRTLAEQAFDAIREAVVIVDTRSKNLPLVLLNSTARSCFGGDSEPSSLVGSSLFGLLDAASASLVQPLLASVAGGEPPLTRLLTWRLTQGERAAMSELKSLNSAQDQRLVMITFAPTAQAADLFHLADHLSFGIPPKWMDSRMAAAPAEASDSHLRALIEDAQDIVAVVAPDGEIRYVSGGARNAFGYPWEELASTKYIFEYVHPDDEEALRAKFGQLTAGLISGFTCQHRVRHQDGSYRWLESSYIPALDNPLINGVVSTSRDITERKQAETQLAQREEVFRLAAEAVDGVIFEWDLMRGIVHRSRGMLEILGIEPEDLAPIVDAWRERIHPYDIEAAVRQIGLALIEGRGWTVTYRIRDARGRYRSMLERGLIQRNSAGDPLRAIGCCVDVTEIKRLTDLLGEAQRTAKMGGWEYSYSTLELTWTDEMFRIFEVHARRIRRFLGVDAGAVHPGVPGAIPRAPGAAPI